MEYQVPAEGPVQPVVRACGNLASQEPALYPAGKDAEFQSLVHDQNAPCVGPSRDWSCIRRLSREEWLARGSEGYGFLANETTPNRVGLQTDSGCVIPLPLQSIAYHTWCTSIIQWRVQCIFLYLCVCLIQMYRVHVVCNTNFTHCSALSPVPLSVCMFQSLSHQLHQSKCMHFPATACQVCQANCNGTQSECVWPRVSQDDDAQSHPRRVAPMVRAPNPRPL